MRISDWSSDLCSSDLFADNPEAAAPAALIETPIYRDGEALQAWQRAFVAQFLAHRTTYGKARVLLADEVGVGKTLSLAASALLPVVLGDGPVRLLVPSTLPEQWPNDVLAGLDRKNVGTGKKW